MEDAKMFKLIMRYVLFMIIMFALIGIFCSANAQSQVNLSIEDFKKDAESRGIEVKEIPKIVAVTNLYNKYGYEGRSDHKNGVWTIYIDHELSQSFFCKILVYHELGHAVLGRADSKKKSIMNTNWFNVDLDSKKGAYFLDELFNKEEFHTIVLNK